jgi:hypothetical protein
VSEEKSVPVGRLILVPAVITLAVTLLRLIGELMNWSPALFSRDGGGGRAIVGIVWLVPVFGVYFAYKLLHMGYAPDGALRAVGFAILGLLIPVAAGFGSQPMGLGQMGIFLVIAATSLVGLFVAMKGWPALGRTLLAYGLAARIPVALVMLIAILGNWGTHYDVVPPDFPVMSPWAKWFLIGVIPQLTIWIAFTVVIGMFFGGLTVAALSRKRTVTA